jgi:hypothetical protein
VKGAGIMPASVEAVALYNKRGDILRPSRDKEAMPQVLPAGPPPPFSLYRREAGHDRVYLFFPIFADPDETALIGYGASRSA